MFHSLRLACLLIVILGALAVSGGIDEIKTRGPLGPGIECRLKVDKERGPEPLDYVADFTLTNTSKTAMKIKYMCHPMFRYLNLDVWDDKGRLLPNVVPNYGRFYSPVSDEYLVNVIEPGESRTARVILLMQVDQEKAFLRPGNYSIQAVYTWEGRQYRSNKVSVKVLSK